MQICRQLFKASTFTFCLSLREQWCRWEQGQEQGGLLLQTESVLGWQTFVNRDGDSWNDVNCGNQRGLSTQETGGYQAEGGAKMLFFTV